MIKVAVVGLGRFGMALAKHLGKTKAQVMAIDSHPVLVNEIKDFVDVAVMLDSTEETALKSQDIGDFNVVVVAIGENFEAALLTTVILKKLGVPMILCRAQTEMHAEIFMRIGADEIIQPETQAGEHLARRLANPHLEDFMNLAQGLTLIELRAPEEFAGRTIKDLRLRNKYQVNLIAIRRTAAENGDHLTQERVIGVPDPDESIQQGDILVLLGSDEALARLPKE